MNHENTSSLHQLFPTPVPLCSMLQDFQSYSESVPEILVQTAWYLTDLGNEQNPRASCLTSSIIRNSKRYGTQLFYCPLPFKFQDSISGLCSINSLAETSTEMARRCFHQFLRTINKHKNFISKPDCSHIPFPLLKKTSSTGAAIYCHNESPKWSGLKMTVFTYF